MQSEFKNGNFIQKLDKLLKNPEFQHIIRWDPTKTYIDIMDPQLMQIEITPRVFRHTKFQSFVRQLNLYGFRKIKGQGHIRFTHSVLLNGQPLLAISNYKFANKSRGPRDEQNNSEVEHTEPIEEMAHGIPQASTQKKEEKRISVPESRREGELNQRQRVLEQITENRPLPPLMLHNQYMYWCNMMSMMYGGRPFPSPFPYNYTTPYQPQ